MILPVNPTILSRNLILILTKHLLFDNHIGVIPNITCTLKLRKDAKLIYRPPRPVPYALLPKVNEQLDRLEREGVSRKIDYCEWGTPLVITPKPSGDVCLCADYKVMINPLLELYHYHILVANCCRHGMIFIKFVWNI